MIKLGLSESFALVILGNALLYTVINTPSAYAVDYGTSDNNSSNSNLPNQSDINEFLLNQSCRFCNLDNGNLTAKGSDLRNTNINVSSG